MSKNRDELELTGTLDFIRLLWGLHHGLQSRSKRMEQRWSVTGPQRFVVRIIGEFPDASAGEIANALKMHPSTLTGILRRLESRRLIERRPDPADARRALFVLTKEGVEVNRIDTGTTEAAIRDVLATAAPADLEATRRMLEGLATALSQ
jgi:DNA-binding MarR family transcriptional regulator